MKNREPTPLDGTRHFLIYYASLFGATGLWRNWLAHWTVDPGVAGSSPVDPASTEGASEIASWCNGSTADSDSACWGSSPCEATIDVSSSEISEFFYFSCEGEEAQYTRALVEKPAPEPSQSREAMVLK